MEVKNPLFKEDYNLNQADIVDHDNLSTKAQKDENGEIDLSVKKEDSQKE